MTARHLQLRCALLALAIVLGGCVYSVESVITESSAAFDARLLGDWKDVGSSEHAVVTRSIRNGYTIEYGSDDTVSRYEAHLGRLGDRLILDVSVPPEDSSPSASGQLPIVWHVVFSLDVGEDEIRVAPIGGDSLTAAIRAGHVRLAAHARSAFCPAMCAPTDLILDGTTEELRDALGSYLASPGAPEPPIVYRRMPRPRTTAPTPTTHADSSIE